jgi:hypothetical protein
MVSTDSYRAAMVLYQAGEKVVRHSHQDEQQSRPRRQEVTRANGDGDKRGDETRRHGPYHATPHLSFSSLRCGRWISVSTLGLLCSRQGWSRSHSIDPQHCRGVARAHLQPPVNRVDCIFLL